ncbi:MAG: ABC transporter substrate-binding protein [Deltaproteobacteria bacterium]|nr:ABC transporter substrate-binding protein [Candidatus Anaeroferrophillus wilburensis]MBN2889498.1 ABC transporter substrate-binding protein [Deltaproteobacteria bacterium]
MHRCPQPIILFFFLLSLTIVAAVPLKAQETISIGVVLPLTGYQEAAGARERQAFEFAEEQVNLAGGIQGRLLHLIFIDSTGSPVQAVEAVKKTMSGVDELLLLTGGCSSPASWAVAAYAQQQQIPFLITTAANPKITRQHWDYIFRLAPLEEEKLLPIARYIKQIEGYQTAAIIYENSICRTETAKKLKYLCADLGLDLAIWSSYRPGRINTRYLGEQLAEKEPEILFLVGNGTDATPLLEYLHKQGNVPLHIVGCTGAFSQQSLWDNAGELANGVQAVAPWGDFLPYEGIERFVNDYRLAFAEAPDYHAAAAQASIDVIRETLSHALLFTREEIRDLLADTDMMTVFGPISFITDGQHTNQNRLTGHLLQWQNGILELVPPPED